MPVGEPTVISRGFVTDPSSETRWEEIPAIVDRVMRSAGREERADLGVLEERIRIELQRLFRKRSGRRPLVIPVLMEI